jgi:hypothetical protein
MTRKKSFLVAPLALGVLSLLAACGGQLSLPGTGNLAPKPAASAAARTTAAPAQPANGQPAAAESKPFQTGAAAQTTAKGAAAAQAATTAAPALPPLDRMVIKNGALSIAVDDPEGATSQVDQLVAAEQGVITSQTVRTQNDKTFVTLTIQVPPDNFEATLAKLRDLRAHGSHVLNDTINSQDVTDQYVDLDAQYRNLSTTRDAYQKLLDKATAVSDIISLTREVANIQTQMDQIKGRQNLLSRQSAISTINLSLSPVGASPLPGPRPLPKPLQAAQDAWQTLQAGLQGLAVVLIWMAVLLPIPAIVLGGGWLVYRRVTRPAYQAEASRN